MMSDPGGNNATDIRSDSVSNGEHGQQIILKLEQPKESPWKQPAVYIAALALIIVIGGEWRRWDSLDDVKADFARQIATLEKNQHDYRNDSSMYMADVFTHDTQVQNMLVNGGVDMSRVKPLRRPPE